MIGWFPRFSASGKITAEGPNKWRAQWDQETEVYDNGVTIIKGGVDTGIPSASQVVASGGVIWTSSAGQVFKNGFPLDAGADPFASSTVAGFVLNPQSNFKSIAIVEPAAGIIPRNAPISEIRASRTLLAWKEGARVFACKLPVTLPLDVTVVEGEGWPVPIDTPTGPWLLTLNQTGFVLRPAGSLQGFRFDNNGQTFNPDAIFLDNQIHVVFTDARGNQDIKKFTISDSLIDLTAPVPVQPAPEPLPGPVPEDPKVPEIPNKFSLVETIRAKYPTPLGQEHKKFLVEIALACGGLLLRKDGGTHVQLSSGHNVSQDILVFGQTLVDILGDGENKAIPAWDVHGDEDRLGGRETYDPAKETQDAPGRPQDDPGPAPEPPPGPTPLPPPPVVPNGILDRLNDLEARLVALEQKPVPTAPPSPKYVAEVSQNGWGPLAHSHKVTIKEIK